MGKLKSNERGLRLSFGTPEEEECAPAPHTSWAWSRIGHLRRSRLVKALAGGSISVIIFFYQMAGLVVPVKGVVANLAGNLKSFFGMQLGGDSSSGSGEGDGGGGGGS
ncbi:MAG: hypothetical protein OSA43_07245, partial [Pirellulales bacterium]|nr:hypothetical protein [Pirellulales bacterium]